MSKHSTRILIVHNIIAPYREPLFSAISSYTSLSVWFCSESDGKRLWQTEGLKRTYDYKILRKVNFIFFTFNPTVILELFKTQYDHYIIIDNEENLFTNLAVVTFAKLKRKKYTVWSGHIPIENGTIHPMDFHKSLLHIQPLKFIFKIFINSVNKFLYKHADSYLAYSEYSKKYLLEAGAIADRNILVGTQAMSICLLPKPKNKLNLDSTKLHFLYLGYLRPEKGIHDLVKVFMRIKGPAELHIVGDGPQKNELVKITRKSKNIIFYPYANEHERARWYSSVDYTILPTYFDPWAHTITESLYYRTPVIVSRSAAASVVIVNGKNGFTFFAGDLLMLEKIINKIVSVKLRLRPPINPRLYDVEADAKNFINASILDNTTL